MTEAQQKIAGSAAPKEDDLKASEAPLIEHLTELRTRLIYSIIALAVLFILCLGRSLRRRGARRRCA